MEYVKDKWYKLFSHIMLAVSAVLLVASFTNLFLPEVTTLLEGKGLGYVTFILALIHLIFSLFIYRIVEEKSGIFVATLISTLIFMVNIVNLLQSTGQLHSWYEILWAFTVFSVGIFGPYSIIGFCFLSVLYLVILITNIPGQIIIDPFNLFVTGLVFVTGFISYLFWRGKYIDKESAKLAQLSGQLQSNKIQSEILLNSLSDGIILIDTTGKIKLINPAASKMTGWGVQEAAGISVETVLKLLSENGVALSETSNPILIALSKKTPATQIFQLVSRNQKSIVVSMVLSPIIIPKTNEFAGAVAVIRDVSANKAEEHRRADFISTASHEMRTPVAAIEGYLALALNDKDAKIDTKARDFLIKAHESTQRLGKLFQDLLTSAKAEDGRLVNRPLVTEMGEYLEQIVEGLRFVAEKKGLLMDFTIGASGADTSAIGAGKVIKPLYYANIDPDRMREVITNLFDNAVKFSESGKISVGLTGNLDIIQFYIRDTGQGIPPEDVPHLFQKFYRVDDSNTRTIGGTGLGLFICRKVVELYGGRIWVESKINKGSTFYINLPRLSTIKTAELQKAESK